MGIFKDLRFLRMQSREMLTRANDMMAGVDGQVTGLNAQMVQNQVLMANGIVGKATITSLADTGATINDNPQVEFGLRVALPDLPPYDGLSAT